MEKTARQGQFFSNNVIEIPKFAVYINESADHLTATRKGVNMKRILLSILAVVLCLSAFSGCDAECEHNWERIEDHGGTPAQEKCTKCGETRPHTVPDSTPSERLSIEMTIAEALPSCVTFEYKDENPYCFYAYDGDGRLYRVLWNNFDGLNEKERVIIDYDGEIRSLAHEEFPAYGRMPQYEIAAISVISNEPPQYQYSSTSVRSGKSAIRPIQCFEGVTQYENGEPTLMGCGGGAYGIFYDPKTKISDFPVLLYSGAMMAFPSANVTLGSIRVYDTAFQELEYKINEIGELASLPHGEYIVTISERIDSRGGNAEIKDYHITDNACLFRFVMRDPPIINGTNTGHSADIKMMRFNWDGYGYLPSGSKLVTLR